MVHGAAFDGGVVDRFHVSVLRQVGGQDEATVDVGARGGHGEVFGRLEDQVGRAELPTLGERGWRRQILEVALRGACLGPGGEDVDLARESTTGRA